MCSRELGTVEPDFYGDLFGRLNVCRQFARRGILEPVTAE
jgi:hypothetical protein